MLLRYLGNLLAAKQEPYRPIIVEVHFYVSGEYNQRDFETRSNQDAANLILKHGAITITVTLFWNMEQSRYL